MVCVAHAHIQTGRKAYPRFSHLYQSFQVFFLCDRPVTNGPMRYAPSIFAASLNAQQVVPYRGVYPKTLVGDH
jgi:hypothetical protein